MRGENKSERTIRLYRDAVAHLGRWLVDNGRTSTLDSLTHDAWRHPGPRAHRAGVMLSMPAWRARALGHVLASWNQAVDLFERMAGDWIGSGGAIDTTDIRPNRARSRSRAS